MKKKTILNNETCPSHRSMDIAAINVTASSIVFNRAAIDMLSLNKGDRVSFEMEDDELFMLFDKEKGITVGTGTKNGLALNRISLRTQLHKIYGAPRFRLELGNFSDGRFPLTVITYDKK
jgi:hypothetical protein